ncbi:unnamed protein product [Medioppia subpectinata]|uniref:C2H2-type domain-containing protein n=1 Tax=Medioppia subpectinata TaxID=1979941 RepID=A0A7R9KFA1_9ACAR|nr:unnamed protein product [Medioppia subpectinata]CAG2101122.1 unnamed protein product [Medioppia subpectinata]
MDYNNEDINEDSDESYGKELNEDMTESTDNVKTNARKIQRVMKWDSNQSLSESLRYNRTERKKYFDFNTNAFICPINECHKSFGTDIRFYGHLYGTHSNQAFKCKVKGCDKVCKNMTCLSSHARTHENRRIRYRCEYKECHKTFLSRPGLKKHSMTHSTQSTSTPIVKKFKCHYSECQKRFARKEGLTEHLERHSSVRPYRCDFIGCGKCFKTFPDLRRHSLVHKTGPTFRCDVDRCVNMFYTEYHRSLHHKSVHNYCPKESAVYVEKAMEEVIEDLDNNCMETTETIDSNNDNKSIKQESVKTDSNHSTADILINNRTEREKCFDLNAKTFKCPLNCCNKSYATNARFLKHLHRFHTNRRFECEFNDCNKVFKTQFELKIHSGIHLSDKPFKCHYNGCDYETHSNKILNRHFVIHSTERPVFRCDVIDCGKTLKSKLSLEKHIQNMHVSGPTLKCGINGCSDMFTNEHQKRKHQTLVHNREPLAYKRLKHRCDWPGCEWTGRGIAEHKRSHTGEKRYQCLWPDCGQQFRKSCHLTNHMNVHNNVRPYACHWPGCQYRATNSANLIAHIKQVHKM